MWDARAEASALGEYFQEEWEGERKGEKGEKE